MTMLHGQSRVRRVTHMPRPRQTSIAVLAGALAGFALLSALVLAGGVDGWDTALLRTAGHLRGAALDRTMLRVTDLGSWAWLAPLTVLTVAVLLVLRRWRPAVLVAAAVSGAEILQAILKPAFGRPRPRVVASLQQVSSAAYPSGHALVSCAFALALCAVCWRSRLRLPATVLAVVYVLAVGFSRVYLGMHYPSDVLASWLVAVAWLAVLGLALAFLPDRRRATHDCTGGRLCEQPAGGEARPVHRRPVARGAPACEGTAQRRTASGAGDCERAARSDEASRDGVDRERD
jgi:membrane-associated phospholipid phosphatase